MIQRLSHYPHHPNVLLIPQLLACLENASPKFIIFSIKDSAMNIRSPLKAFVRLSFPILVISIFFALLVYVVPTWAQNDAGVYAVVQPGLSLKSVYSEPIDKAREGKQAVISVSLKNKNQTDLSVVTFVEVRDFNGITQYLAYQTSNLEAGGEAEFGVSWLPMDSGKYSLRTLCVTGLENPNILSTVIVEDIIVEG
jgi:hypothetical protein